MLKASRANLGKERDSWKTIGCCKGCRKREPRQAAAGPRGDRRRESALADSDEQAFSSPHPRPYSLARVVATGILLAYIHGPVNI